MNQNIQKAQTQMGLMVGVDMEHQSTQEIQSEIDGKRDSQTHVIQRTSP